MQQVINLDRNTKRLIAHLIENQKFSEWISNKIHETFGNDEHYKLKIQELNDKIIEFESIRLKLKKDAAEQVKVKIEQEMTQREKNWWVTTIKVIDNDPGYMKGRYALYKNEFGISISLNDFIDKLADVRHNDMLYPLK